MDPQFVIDQSSDGSSTKPYFIFEKQMWKGIFGREPAVAERPYSSHKVFQLDAFSSPNGWQQPEKTFSIFSFELHFSIPDSSAMVGKPSILYFSIKVHFQFLGGQQWLQKPSLSNFPIDVCFQRLALGKHSLFSMNFFSLRCKLNPWLVDLSEDRSHDSG